MTNRRDFLKSACIIVATLWMQPKLLSRRATTYLKGFELDAAVLASHHGATVYVSMNGSDLNDGLSPETAKYTLSAAVQALSHREHTRSAIYASGYIHDETITVPADATIYLADHTIMKHCVLMGDIDA